MTVKVHIHSLGCPKNDADSAALRRRLEAAGVQVVSTPSRASHILINTCGFIEEAKEESIGALLDATASYPQKEVLAMGCLVQRYREDLEAAIPEVQGWFGLGETDRLVIRLVSGSEGAPARVRAERHARPWAYVKISDGCDHRCSFCAIPGIKGPYASLSSAQVREQAQAALAEGARELVLVGQDTAAWRDGERDLVDLLCELASWERVQRLRLLYLQPENVSEALLDFMAGEAKACRYLDIPFQHASAGVLRRMRRRGAGPDYLALLSRARIKMPDVTLRSTFIVGFPGETEEDFAELVDFVEQARFTYAGAFAFSPEEGTAAAGLAPRVPEPVARQRLARLGDILLSRAEDVLAELVGSPVQVLVERPARVAATRPQAVGRTAGQAPEIDGVTYLTGPGVAGLRSGDTTWATVTEWVGPDLVARVDDP